jgi:hypothetical protein
MGGHETYHWRKLGYITEKQVANLETKLGSIDKVGGYSALTSAQQKTLAKAFEAARKKGKAKDKAKLKIVAAKAKAKAAKEKARVAKAKAKAKVKGKGKAKAKALSKKGVAELKPKPLERVVAAARGAAAPPVAKQHLFLDHAKSFDFKTCREMLEETPELVNMQPSGRWSALHQAAEAGKPTAVKMLLSKGADVNLKTKSGQTPRDVAHSTCVSLLTPPAKTRG